MPLRFVLLRHECPARFTKPSHWDFMLETEGRLMTWELRQLPASWLVALQLESADALPLVPATRLADVCRQSNDLTSEEQWRIKCHHTLQRMRKLEMQLEPELAKLLEDLDSRFNK